MAARGRRARRGPLVVHLLDSGSPLLEAPARAGVVVGKRVGPAVTTQSREAAAARAAARPARRAPRRQPGGRARAARCRRRRLRPARFGPGLGAGAWRAAEAGRIGRARRPRSTPAAVRTREPSDRRPRTLPVRRDTPPPRARAGMTDSELRASDRSPGCSPGWCGCTNWWSARGSRPAAASSPRAAPTPSRRCGPTAPLRG